MLLLLKITSRCICYPVGIIVKSRSIVIYWLELPVKGLWFAHWNVNYMTKTKMEEIKMPVPPVEGWSYMVITETCFSNKTNEDLFAIPGYDLFRN